MVNIYNNIFQYAKEYITTNSTYDPYVLKATPEESKVFPLVIITQTNDYFRDETLKKTEKQNVLSYEINIFAKDTTVNRQTIIEELVYIVNDVFENKIGFRRIQAESIPNIDLSVDRFVLEYEGVFDEKTNKIFRK